MNFEKHLFISYAHLDNQPLLPETKGWITRFHESLKAFLSMRMGTEAQIWRDDRLQGTDIFADEIIKQFPRTALLVSVLTPRYINSEWCVREVNAFTKVAQDNGGVVVDNKSRVIKIIKTPIDQDKPIPNVLERAIGYEFYAERDGAPLELDPQEDPQEYKRKINKLAWDVTQLLKKLENHSANGSPALPTPADKPIIYLAECSYDRKREREILELDLKRHGYSILPDQALPREEADYVTTVAALLKRCQLSIHLVGRSYGAVPDGPTWKSIVVLQNELAVERSRTDRGPEKNSKNDQFKRIIWLPKGCNGEQEQQQKFIHALQRDSHAQFAADLISGDIEELKTSIHDTLKHFNKIEPELTTPSIGTKKCQQIYLMCFQTDRKATVPLRKWLRDQDMEVSLPTFEGDATQVRKANQDLLTHCDAVLVFYGAGNETWKRTIDNELKRMASYRNGKPLLARYTYLAGPKTNDKDDLIDMEEPNLIEGIEGFDENAMAPFIKAMHIQKGES